VNIAPSAIIALTIVVIAVALAIWRRREVTTIYAPLVGLLYRDGRFERELAPGRYAWFDPFARRRVVQVSTAELAIVLPEVTVLSKDQFSFRLALSPMLAVVDARRFAEAQSMLEPSHLRGLAGPITAGHAALSPLVAAAALETVSTRTLAEIMADPGSVPAAVGALVADAVPGATVTRVLFTGINLPPETRKMFTDVERAKMEAQGALERARGEQAALRVLANAARLVSDNPALANLRLLQAIESSKGSTTIIVGDAVASPSGFPARPSSSSQ
jgi:regulator of protease activity HflC (stomatin/prohibitin superfamily)